MNQPQAEPAKEIPMQNTQQQTSPDVLSGLAQSLGMRPEEFTQLIGTLKQTPQMLNMFPSHDKKGLIKMMVLMTRLIMFY